MIDVLLTRHWGRWRARFAARVTASVDLATLTGYAELSTEDRLGKAAGEDAAYLAGLARHGVGDAFEMRWLAGFGDEPALTLLGRVERDSETETRDAASAALGLLTEVSEHVRAEVVTGEDAIARAFEPFGAEPLDAVELRRPVLRSTPTRPDAGVRFYLAVPPWSPDPLRRPSLLVRLAQATAPVMLTVGIEPVRAPSGLPELLSGLAARYARLAEPGEMPPGELFMARKRLAPEPFAIDAAAWFHAAAERYRGDLMRLRVCLAAPRRLDAALVRAVDDAVAHGSGAVERPERAEDRAVLTEALARLGVPRWGGHPVWKAGSAPEALRLLTELADPVEASAAFWLPAAAAERPAGLPVVEPPPGRRADRAGVAFYDSDVRIDNSVLGGNQYNTGK